jgi:hypothetical protein
MRYQQEFPHTPVMIQDEKGISGWDERQDGG